jgi:hypothetical protein
MRLAPVPFGPKPAKVGDCLCTLTAAAVFAPRKAG